MGTGELLGQRDRMLGSNLRWASIPPRGNSNTPSRFMLQKPGLNARSYEPVWLYYFIYGLGKFFNVGLSHARRSYIKRKKKMSVVNSLVDYRGQVV